MTWEKKQKVVELSSAKAEFRGIVKGMTVLWLKNVLTEIGFPPSRNSLFL